MTTQNSGIGVIGALGVVFVALKLMGYIDWSWWLVTLPFWWVLAAYGVLATVLCILLMLRFVGGLFK